MEQNLQHILIFKTNIKTEADRQAVKKLLDDHSCIRQWNVDLQDVDCVLRIVLRQAQDDRHSLTTQEAIALVVRG